MQGTKLELVEIVKVNAEYASHMDYYITFKAKDASGEMNTYQTTVRTWFPEPNHEIELVRLEPIGARYFHLSGFVLAIQV